MVSNAALNGTSVFDVGVNTLIHFTRQVGRLLLIANQLHYLLCLDVLAVTPVLFANLYANGVDCFAYFCFLSCDKVLLKAGSHEFVGLVL